MHKLSFNFTRIVNIIAIALIVSFVFSQFFTKAQAAIGINRQINFQGKLVNNPASTNVSDTTYTVVFTFYNNASGGTALWSETQSVTTTDGIFRVALGSVTPFPANFNFNWSGLYLGIEVNAPVNDPEMTPRIQMSAVPFAFNAEKVAGLTVQDTSGNASTSGTLQVANARTVTFADAFSTANALSFGAGTTGTITLGTGTNTLQMQTTNNTNITLPTTGTLLTNTAALNQTITSTQTTGNVLSLTDSTGLTGGITGLTVGLTSSTNSQNKTGISFDLSGGTGGVYYDLLGTGSTWSLTRAGVLSVASCVGCGSSTGVNWWNQLGGVLSPLDTTNDFLLGSTATSSALFSYTGIKTGQTIASASGQLIVMANNGWGGQLGIGTTAPIYNLDVLGTARVGNQQAINFGGTKVLYSNYKTTDTTQGAFATIGSLEVDPSGASSQIYYGGFYSAQSTSGNAQNITGRLVGFQGQVSHGGTGTLGQARGFAGFITNANSGIITDAFAGRFGNVNSSTGSITNAYGVYIQSPTNSGGGTYNTNYGLYVGDQSNVGVVDSYNIWSDGFNSKNYFAGSVGIGATPSARLHVAGSWGSNAAVIIDQLNSGDILVASASGTTKFRVANNGNLVLSAAINLGGTNGTSSDCLKGGATAAWGSCGGSSSSGPFAEITGGVIVPNNSTVDFLIGGQSTASALFAITGVAAGTPVATLSASTNNNGLVLSAATSTIQSLRNNALILGGNTTGDIYLMPGTGMVFIGENEVKSGGLTFYSSGVGETDPTITANATGNLVLSAPTGTVEVGSGTGNVSLEGDADTSIVASFIGIPAADMFQITNAGQAITANGVDGLALAYVLGGSSAVTNAGFTVDLTTTNNNASTVLRGINIGNITGQASATEVGLRIGTGWDSGLSIESGGITIAGSATDITTGANEDLTITSNGTGDLILTSDADTGVNIGTSSNTPATLSVSGGIGSNASLIVNRAGSTDDIFAASSSGTTKFVIGNSGTVTIGNSTDGLVFNPTTANNSVYSGAARPTKKITLNAEYPGAVLTASGSAVTTGSMTSDASPSAALSNWRTYYEWSSSTASPLQDYTIVVRVKLPEDFSAWALTNALTISYNTELNGSGSNKMDVIIYNADTSLSAIDQSTPVVMRTDNVSASDKTWLDLSIDDSALDSGAARDLDAAGETAVIYLKMYSMNNNHVQIGDIVLSYLSKF